MIRSVSDRGPAARRTAITNWSVGLATLGSPSPRPSPLSVFSAMVGGARCAVPARVLAGGTNSRAAVASERVAPLYAARTSQRDVPTTLNTYSPLGRRRMVHRLSITTVPEFTQQLLAKHPSEARCPLSLGSLRYVLSTMVGMARRAVSARVVAGGMNVQANTAFEGVAPLHAARTSQRDVPTAQNTYSLRER